jgi:hypothetical protein
MTVKVTKPALNLREELSSLKKPSGVAGEAMLRAETPQEQFNLIGAGRKNLIINGDFRIAQRGDFSSPVSITAGDYTLDRWKDWSSASVAPSVETNITEVDGKSQYVFRVEANASATGTNLGMRQFVEKLNLRLGETYTISCYLRTNNSSARLRAYRLFGSAGKQTDPIPADEQWHYVSLTGTYTFDTNPEVGAIIFGDETGTTVNDGDYLEIASYQCEVGSVATPFEHRSYGEELALCQRYCYAVPVLASSGFQFACRKVNSASTGATTNSSMFVGLNVPKMRATPSWSSPVPSLRVEHGGTILSSVTNIIPRDAQNVYEFYHASADVTDATQLRFNTDGILVLDAEL